jgi:HEAT repeat protein
MRLLGQVGPIVFSCSIVISCALLAGCVQETPTPSVDRAIALLVTLLQDEYPDVRRTAVESLGKIGDRKAIPAVLPVLTDAAPAVRAAAARALGRMAGPADEDVIAGLARALQDPSENVKQLAALAINDLEPSSTQLTLTADLLRAPDVEVRRAAVRALVTLDTGHIAGRLLPLLDDPDAEVRQTAVAALGFSGNASAGAALAMRLAKDPSPAVRAEAAYHLGRSNEPTIQTLLQTAAKLEADGGVRRWIEADLRVLRAND